VLVDADVDASNLELLLEPTPIEAHDYIAGQVAVIDPELCTACGTCEDVCRFDAIHQVTVDPLACEGCGACATQCPIGAIQLKSELAGHWYQSRSRFGTLFHAALNPGAENSGKLVTLIRQQAIQSARRDHHPLVIVDGPPGIGCPVIAAVSGADLAVIVAEPTVSGVHDLERVLATVRHFGVQALVCINKADLYPEGSRQIEAACDASGLPVIGQIPFDTVMVEAMIQGQPITLYQPDGPISKALNRAWQAITQIA
jgi:MinD superfamily P-loop ATPase